MQQAHPGAMPADAFTSATILTFPGTPDQKVEGLPDLGEPSPPVQAAREMQVRRIPGLVLGLLALPGTMLLMEVVRRLIEG